MQGLKVLLVEDDGNMRGLYCFLLAREGCKVKAVRNGLEAMAEIEANRPDILITDIAMPVFGGLHLIKALRSQSEFADLPILAVTAFSEHFHEQAFEAGANHAIGKPTEVTELCEAIKFALAQPGQQSATISH